MNTRQAAAALGVSRRRIAQLAAAGRFPGARLEVRDGRAGWEIPDAAVSGFERMQRGRKAHVTAAGPHAGPGAQHKEGANMRQYDIVPLAISKWTDLHDFDEYEARKAGWPERLIRDAIHEVQRRELDDN